MVSPDDPYVGYSTTAQVTSKAGIGDQDDIKPRSVNDAIKAADKFIDRETKTSWSPYTGVTSPPSDISMVSTFLAAAMVVIELDSEQTKKYADFVNMAMMLLAKFTSTDPTVLAANWGFMLVSSGNTTPFNPDADPFISINQPW